MSSISLSSPRSIRVPVTAHSTRGTSASCSPSTSRSSVDLIPARVFLASRHSPRFGPHIKVTPPTVPNSPARASSSRLSPLDIPSSPLSSSSSHSSPSSWTYSLPGTPIVHPDQGWLDETIRRVEGSLEPEVSAARDACKRETDPHHRQRRHQEYEETKRRATTNAKVELNRLWYNEAFRLTVDAIASTPDSESVTLAEIRQALARTRPPIVIDSTGIAASPHRRPFHGIPHPTDDLRDVYGDEDIDSGDDEASESSSWLDAEDDTEGQQESMLFSPAGMQNRPAREDHLPERRASMREWSLPPSPSSRTSVRSQRSVPITPPLPSSVQSGLGRRASQRSQVSQVGNAHLVRQSTDAEREAQLVARGLFLKTKESTLAEQEKRVEEREARVVEREAALYACEQDLRARQEGLLSAWNDATARMEGVRHKEDAANTALARARERLTRAASAEQALIQREKALNEKEAALKKLGPQQLGPQRPQLSSIPEDAVTNTESREQERGMGPGMGMGEQPEMGRTGAKVERVSSTRSSASRKTVDRRSRRAFAVANQLLGRSALDSRGGSRVASRMRRVSLSPLKRLFRMLSVGQLRACADQVTTNTDPMPTPIPLPPFGQVERSVSTGYMSPVLSDIKSTNSIMSVVVNQRSRIKP